MSRSGHAVLIVGIAIILSVMLFFSLSTYAEDGDGLAREAHLEDLQCKDCHGRDRFLPSYHKPAGKWKRRHGHRVNTMMEPARRVKAKIPLKPGHVYDCGLCHVDDACRKCHQLNRPDDHTGFWRMRGHGIRALAKRESCAFCHVETFCVRCHQNTKPINHRIANWRGGLHATAVAGGQHAERCWVCHPRVIPLPGGSPGGNCICHP